jgi:hypothetical protein
MWKEKTHSQTRVQSIYMQLVFCWADKQWFSASAFNNKVLPWCCPLFVEVENTQTHTHKHALSASTMCFQKGWEKFVSYTHTHKHALSASTMCFQKGWEKREMFASLFLNPRTQVDYTISPRGLPWKRNLSKHKHKNKLNAKDLKSLGRCTMEGGRKEWHCASSISTPTNPVWIHSSLLNPCWPYQKAASRMWSYQTLFLGDYKETASNCPYRRTNSLYS